MEAAIHPIVLVSGILGLLVSPYAAFQQRKLTQLEALHQTNAALEEEVEGLENENMRYKKAVQELEESVLNLQAMEEALETLQSLQQQQHRDGKTSGSAFSIQELQDQLEESQKVLAAMNSGGNNRNTTTGELLQHLIAAMLVCENKSDEEEDGDNLVLLSDEDIDALVDSLEATPGVRHVNEHLLRQIMVEEGRSLTALMEITKNLLLSTSQQQGDDDDELPVQIPEEQCIFRLSRE